jgi:hypothetical protein
MHATYARELTAEEVDELPVVFDLPELQGKRWFYVELSNGTGVDIMATDREQAKQYAVGNYHSIH